jgi:phosphinothricin acetyltransferase
MEVAARLAIRHACEADLPAIQRIYNDEVVAGVATWDEQPWPDEQRRRWFADHRASPSTPVLVAVHEGRVAGWASLSPMSAKSGWRLTREDTIYLDPAFRGQGVGRLLLAALLEEARRTGVHVVVASITSENAASLALHRKAGFEVVGTLREAGFKFGRRLDTTYLQVILGPRGDAGG